MYSDQMINPLIKNIGRLSNNNFLLAIYLSLVSVFVVICSKD